MNQIDSWILKPGPKWSQPKQTLSERTTTLAVMLMHQPLVTKCNLKSVLIFSSGRHNLLSFMLFFFFLSCDNNNIMRKHEAGFIRVYFRDLRLTVCCCPKLWEPHEASQDAGIVPCYVNDHTRCWNGIMRIKCKFLFGNSLQESHHTSYRKCA